MPPGNRGLAEGCDTTSVAREGQYAITRQFPPEINVR